MRMNQLAGGLPGRLGLLTGAALLVFAGCNSSQSAETVQANLQPGVPPAVSINAVMVGMVDHAGHVIWDVGTKAPQTDHDWRELEHHAIQLAAAGSLITHGGTGPADPGWAQQVTWRKYANEMSDEAMTALKAARGKDQAAILKVGDQLAETCENCHKEFKPELPSEGLVHPHDR